MPVTVGVKHVLPEYHQMLAKQTFYLELNRIYVEFQLT